MRARFTALRSELMQLEAEASAIRLDYELDPGSLCRRTKHFAQRTRLPLLVSRSLVLQAVGLEDEVRAEPASVHDTIGD
ncbi:MAG: hypothetical protein ACE37F_24570 [Nannocystaceae bacterium]|nr:hypothetical protein [bacterium]